MRSEAGGGAELSYIAGWTVLLTVSSGLNCCFSGRCLCDFVSYIELLKGQVAEYTSSFARALKFIVLAVADGLFGLCVDLYRAVQRNWFARVNALCNLSRKKSREVAAVTSWADFGVGVASRCV